MAPPDSAPLPPTVTDRQGDDRPYFGRSSGRILELILIHDRNGYRLPFDAPVELTVMEHTMDSRQITALLTAAETAHRREMTELEQFAGTGRSPRDLSGDLDDVGQHPADAATDTAEREMDLGLLEDVRLVLAEIEAARHRLETGTFGCCESCNEAIADERLQAVPWTRRCRDHQADLERSMSWPAGPPSSGAIGETADSQDDPLWDPEDDDDALSSEESAMHDIVD